MDQDLRPGVAASVAFIKCINAGDIEGLRALMTEDHILQVHDEPPVIGRDANAVAWRAYTEAFPDYVIVPREFVELHGGAAVLGHTIGSHLALPHHEEQKATVIWVAGVERDQLSLWRILDDIPINRQRFGLTGAVRDAG